MIRTLDDLPDGVIGFEATGTLRSADYTQVVGPAVEAASAGGGRIRIVLVFPEGFGGIEPAAMWQDLKLGVRDWSAWERIALVTDVAWMRDGLRMFAWAIPGDARVFGLDQRDHAIAWAATGQATPAG